MNLLLMSLFFLTNVLCAENTITNHSPSWFSSLLNSKKILTPEQKKRAHFREKYLTASTDNRLLYTIRALGLMGAAGTALLGFSHGPMGQHHAQITGGVTGMLFLLERYLSGRSNTYRKKLYRAAFIRLLQEWETMKEHAPAEIIPLLDTLHTTVKNQSIPVSTVVDQHIGQLLDAVKKLTTWPLKQAALPVQKQFSSMASIEKEVSHSENVSLSSLLSPQSQDNKQRIMALLPLVFVGGAVLFGLNRNELGVGVSLSAAAIAFGIHRYMERTYEHKLRAESRTRLFHIFTHWEYYRNKAPDQVVVFFDELHRQYPGGTISSSMITDDHIKQFMAFVGSVPSDISSTEDVNKLLFVIDEIGLNYQDSEMFTFNSLLGTIVDVGVGNVLGIAGGLLTVTLLNHYFPNTRGGPEVFQAITLGIFVLYMLRAWYFSIAREYNALYDRMIFFIRHWPTYKKMTPEKLHDFFTLLHEKFGSLEQITPQDKILIYRKIKKELHRAGKFF